MKKIEEIITKQIELYNEIIDEPVDLSNGSDSILFGKGGTLDSVDFVSLIVDVEQAIEDETGRRIVLSDAKALSQKNSPFRTISTLAEYVRQNMV